MEPCFGSRTDVPTPALLPASTVPVEYLIVNRETASQRCADYVQKLPLDRIASDHQRDLYRLNPRRNAEAVASRYVLPAPDRMTIDLKVLKCGNCEESKLGVHALALAVAALCGALQRRRLVEPARTASRGEHDRCTQR